MSRSVPLQSSDTRPHLALCLTAAVLGAGCGQLDDDGELPTELDETIAQAATVTAYNNDPEYLIVWNQNVAQFGNGVDGATPPAQVAGMHWKNIVRCIKDSTCNGFNVLPDVFVLQEISRAECESFDNYLEAQLSGGANTWDWSSQENHRSTSNHWMSGCTLFRRARLEKQVTQSIVQVTGNGDTCTDQGTRMNSVALEDTRRVAAGSPTTWVTIANRHDDHFGEAKDTCDNAVFGADGVHVSSWDPTTNFCVYQNTRRLSSDMHPTGLQIMAGDFNYEAKHCSNTATPAGRPNDYFRCHYKAITAGLGDCAGATFRWPNLGWTDVVGALLPSAYTDNKWDIDYVFTRYSAGAILMPATARNYVPGRIAKGFYTPAGDAYHPTEAQKTENMSDHDGLLVKIRY